MKRLAAILFGASLATFAQAQAQAACGTLETSFGDVKIESAQTKKVSAAPKGAKICSGDTIIAGKDSRAKIKMEDGNELNISPDSKIALENYEYKPAENKKKVLLNVLSGKVRASTKQENMYNDKSKDGQANTFQVRTKSAVAGVRGTDFLTGYNPSTQKSEVVTFKGKVEVGQPGPGGSITNSVQVLPGQKTEAAPGQPPAAPRPMPKAEFEELKKESKADTASGPKDAAGAQGGDKKEDGDKGDKKDDGAKSEKQDGASGDDKKAGDDKKSDDKKSGDDKKSADAKSDDKKGGDDKKSADNKGDGNKSADGKKESQGGDKKQAGAGPDKKGGDNQGGSASGGGSVAGGTSGDGSRSPASESKGPAPGAPPPPAAGPAPGGTLTAMPPPPPPPPTSISLPPLPPTIALPTLPPPLPKCDFCNTAIQSGPVKLNVVIKPPTQ